MAAPELQATLEFSVEYNKFYNVDLFQRGYYNIRTSLKTNPKTPSKIEVTLPKASEETLVLPSCVVNGKAHSKTFQILYRNEDVPINDLIVYRLHTLIDSTKILESLEKLDLQVLVELWFSEEDNGQQTLQDSMECVSQRTLQLHFSPTRGVHHHIPLLFDYFHLCALEITVHGTLIAIHQPYLSVPRPQQKPNKPIPEPATLEMVYFGTKTVSGDPLTSPTMKMHNAYNVHKRLCTVLLSAYESLQSTFQLYLTKTTRLQFRLEKKDCHGWLESLVNNLQNFDNEEDLLQTATTHITQLCAENVILWTQFLEVISLDQSVMKYLAQEHHNARVKRFAEGFFTHEYPKPECLSCYEHTYHGHTEYAELVRNSQYFRNLPPLSVECLEIDGDASTMPIIFEDIYCDHIPMVLEKKQKKFPSDIFQTSFNPLDVKPEVDIARDRPYSVQGKKSSKAVVSKSDSNNSQNGGDSPKQRMKHKKFIKNIRPEAFRRPSSYSCSEAETVQGKKKEDDCVLVGYRKTDVSNEIAVSSQEPVVLGTFSLPEDMPLSDLDHSPLSNSVSIPYLFIRNSRARTSITSLPGSFDGKHYQKRQRNAHSEVLSHKLFHSDPGYSCLSSDKETEEDNDLMDKNVNADDEDGNIDDNDSPSCGSDSQQNQVIRSESIDQTLPDEESQPILPPSKQKRGVPGHCGKQRRKSPLTGAAFTNLANDITKALNEDVNWYVNAEVQGSDHSDDDANVANGYDTFLDSAVSAESSQLPTGNDISNKSSKTSNSSLRSEEDSMHVSQQDGKESSLCLSKDSGFVSMAGGSLSNLSKGNLSALEEDKNSRPLGTGLSETSASMSELNSNDNSLIAGDSNNLLEDRFTVIEFLKNEYTRKDQRNEPRVTHMRSVTTTNQHQQRSSSEINLHVGEGSSAAQSNHKETEKGDSSGVMASHSYPDLSKHSEQDFPKLVSAVGYHTLSFVTLKEAFKQQLKYEGQLYSERATLASTIPYLLSVDSNVNTGSGIHLVVCVHGLDGNSADLRLVRTYIEMSLPDFRIEFLMSERNQDTFADFEVMTDRLESEILSFIELYGLNPSRVSFIGHSLGTLIIRSVITRPRLAHLVPKLYTFLSLSGPHLGTLYNSSGLVNVGMWFIQKWKKSGSLLQLSLKDHPDPRQSFLYKLSQKAGIEMFRHVLLVGSSQDRYVPYHSSRIEMCKAAQKESSGMGAIYSEMVANILTPVVNNPKCKLVRYDVFHALNNNTNTIIGRAAHIAVLDSEIFIEKFLTVTGLNYFR